VKCIPKKNSRAYSNSSQVDWLLDIDCATCRSRTSMCRVRVTQDEMDEWIAERGVEVTA
jgi:hypothetical protein